MSIVSTLATSAIDQWIHGQLEKAALQPVKDQGASGDLTDFTFQFNPETITIKRYAATSSQATHGSSDVNRQQQASPEQGRESEIILKNIIFDTYEHKPSKSVYTEYIERLEEFCGYNQGKHAPLRLLFNWGKFSGNKKSHLQLQCWLDEFQVDYTMFLNDGTPVRAKVDLTLKTGKTPQEQDEENQKNSPDHAKMVTVRRGDTLAAIAYAEYDNSAEWRRIADANGIDDPMGIRPGMKLLVPPILS